MVLRLIPVMALVVLAGCGSPSRSESVRFTPSAGPTTAAPQPSAPASVARILEFEAPNLAGGRVTGADFAGKDVAVWFWAPW